MNMDYGCCFVSCSTLAFNFAVSTFFNEFLEGRSPEVLKVTVHQIFCYTNFVSQVMSFSSQEQDYIFRQLLGHIFFFCKLEDVVSKFLVSHCVDKVIRSMILQPF